MDLAGEKRSISEVKMRLSQTLSDRRESPAQWRMRPVSKDGHLATKNVKVFIYNILRARDETDLMLAPALQKLLFVIAIFTKVCGRISGMLTHSRKQKICRLACIPVALVITSGIGHAHHSQTPVAPIMDPVAVDGKLDDWPSGLQHYSFDRSDWGEQMRRQYSHQHRPGAYFMSGYSPDENLLYVAVQVEDLDLTVGNSWDKTDGVEVYVSDKRADGMSKPTQHVLVPEGDWLPGSQPGSSGHGVARSGKTRAAYSYDGQTITYEWQIEVFGNSASQASVLSPGQQLGFDVVILDMSSRGDHRWIPWGSPESSKMSGNQRVGRLTLTNERVSAGTNWGWPVSGRWLGNILLLSLAAFALVGLGYFLRGRLSPAVARGGLESRLTQIEERLTETQEVMIALSEKHDHLAEEHRPLKNSAV